MVDLAQRLLGELGAQAKAEARLCRLCDLESCGRARGRCPVLPAHARRAAL